MYLNKDSMSILSNPRCLGPIQEEVFKLALTNLISNARRSCETANKHALLPGLLWHLLLKRCLFATPEHSPKLTVSVLLCFNNANYLKPSTS